MHGVGVLSPWLEVILVDSELLRERLDMRGVFVEKDLFPISPEYITQETFPEEMREKHTVPTPACMPFSFGRVWFFHNSSGTAPVLTNSPNVSITISHSFSCSWCRRTRSRVDWVLKELGTCVMAALTSSSICESETGLVLPSL